MKMPKITLLSFTALLAAHAPAATLVSLSSFGGGDGWRAPNEIIAGDTPGTASGVNYNYLGTGNLERGLAYNPATGNLILVSRSTAGNGIRVLSGTTGADIGALNQGSGIISGGTFTTNMVGAASDGSIFVGNLTTNAASSNFKVYQWASEAAASPTTFFNSAITSSAATRLGDSFDVIESGSSTTIVAGAGSGALGYATISSSGATRVQAFTPSGIVAGDFRLGITFGPGSADVWGKQTGTALRETTSAGVNSGSATLTATSEVGLDYAVVGSTPYLAAVDGTSSTVRVYDATDPLNLSLVASANLTSGTLASNVNITASLKWGAISGDTATLYAMSTNQGIQALTFQIPEPSTLLLGGLGLGLLIRRRR